MPRKAIYGYERARADIHAAGGSRPPPKGTIMTTQDMARARPEDRALRDIRMQGEKRVFPGPPLALIMRAAASYAIYLMHSPVVSILARVLQPLEPRFSPVVRGAGA